MTLGKKIVEIWLWTVTVAFTIAMVCTFLAVVGGAVLMIVRAIG